MHRDSFVHRLRRPALLVALGSILFLAPSLASASCIVPPEDGRWQNVDPNTRSLTRVDLRFVCQDVILNGQPHPPGPPWYMHLWGKCHPSDCNWGEVGATRLPSGHVYATYDQGFAKRYVYARMSVVFPGRLWVWTWTDFTDPSRPDYSSSNYFERVGG